MLHFHLSGIADFQCTCSLPGSGGEVSLWVVKRGVQEVARVFYVELDVWMLAV